MSNKVGRTIFYDIQTGSVLVDTGDRVGDVIYLSPTELVKVYIKLTERNPDTFDYIELEYGKYAQDFMECNGYKINVDDKTIEFSYPDDNLEPEELVYQAPLSEQVEELKQKNTLLEARNNALSERADFIEDVVTEMAIQIYQ